MVVIRAFGALGHPVEALIEFGEVVHFLPEKRGLFFDGPSLKVRGHLDRRRWGCRQRWWKQTKPSGGRGGVVGFKWSRKCNTSDVRRVT